MAGLYDPTPQINVADPSTTLTTISPVDGSPLLTRPYPTSTAQLDHQVQQAHDAHRQWRKVPLADRIKVVTAAVDHLASRALDLGPELTSQMGRPKRYTAAEIATFKDRAQWLLAHADKALKDENVDEGRPEGFTRIIRRTPVGVCLLVGAWNVRLQSPFVELSIPAERALTLPPPPPRSFPVRSSSLFPSPSLTDLAVRPADPALLDDADMITVNALIPALLAGNSVLLKPSPQTPLVAERIQESFEAAGLPANLLQVRLVPPSLSPARQDASALTPLAALAATDAPPHAVADGLRRRAPARPLRLVHGQRRQRQARREDGRRCGRQGPRVQDGRARARRQGRGVRQGGCVELSLGVVSLRAATAADVDEVGHDPQTATRPTPPRTSSVRCNLLFSLTLSPPSSAR